ncbi:MAG: SDR family NAD(P)-dependent oxidoreductase [Sphingobacteriales bacterium]|nr:MAG: SDR family NAD(P)-dependent oxidoreductase [Sphingobacteriales bacterium]
MKIILITGAAGNLGTAVVEKFLSQGYKVIATAHHATEIQAKENLEIVELNVFDETACKDLMSELVKKYSRIDAAALLVGGFAMGKLEETTDESLQKMIQLNFLSAFHLVAPLITHFKENKSGKIILMGAMGALNPASGKNMMAYSLSKSLLFQFNGLLNAAGKELNVNSLVIAPSTIDTPQNRTAMPNADFNKWNKPTDIAQMMFEFSEGSRSEEVIKL